MRIISSFKDFYDGGQSYGLDRSVLYVRETTILTDPNSNGRLEDFNPFYVGFCGKIYSGVVYVKYNSNLGRYDFKYFYHHEELKEFIEENNLFTKNTDWYLSSPYNKSNFSSHFGINLEQDRYNLLELFEKYKTPCFVKHISLRKTFINPCLKDWEFYRVFDSFTAYVELSMYVGNVLLSPEKPIPVPDDVTLASIKGFDKYSFRKDKSK